MNFSNKGIRIKFEGGGEVLLKNPTTQQLNAFSKAAYPIGRKGGLKDTADTVGARVAFFDELFVHVKDCKVDGDPIPEDGKGLIPDLYKNSMIIRYVEDTEDAFASKNS